jgi:hypothetical protein
MVRSLEQIGWGKSVGELRKEYSRLGLTHVIRDGKEVPTSNARRQELIDAISAYEVSQETSSDSTVVVIEPVEEVPATEETEIVEETQVTEVTKVVEEVPTIEATEQTTQPKVSSVDSPIDYTQYEADLKRLATKYYQGFKSDDVEIVGVRQFATEQMKRAQTGQSLMDARLFGTVAHFKEDLLSYSASGSEDGKPNPSTVINLRVEIINRIKKAVSVERQQFTITQEIEGMEPIISDYLTQSFEAFRSGAIAAFSTIAREKRESQGTNFLARRTSTPHAGVSDLIIWAIERVKNLPTKAHQWREVALAVMILTGRRPAEVTSTGVFKAIDQTYIEFYGQLKKKGKDNDEKVYRIPAIGDTAVEIEVAIGWLEMMNKRVSPVSRSLEDKQNAAKKSHDRFSRYLSEIANEIMPSRLELADGANWELDENRSRIKPYLARQIYLQLISKITHKAVNNGVSIDPDLAVTYYSGHYLSVDGKDANAENYLADIVISDLEAIEKIWDWKPDLTIEELESIRQK